MSATATPRDLESFRFSSEDLRPADRVPFYREVIGRGMARFDKEPVGERFFCNAHYYRLPDLNISRIASGAVRANRTRAMAEGSSELILAMNLEGVHTVSQLGRERSHLADSSILFSGADPSHIEHTTAIEHTAVGVVLVGVPRTVLAPMLSNADAALMSVIPNTIEPLRLLLGYIDLLVKDPAVMETAEVRRLAVHHVHDLVAMALGATRDAAELAAGRGLRAARLRAIKSDITQNLGQATSPPPPCRRAIT